MAEHRQGPQQEKRRGEKKHEEPGLKRGGKKEHRMAPTSTIIKEKKNPLGHPRKKKRKKTSYQFLPFFARGRD